MSPEAMPLLCVARSPHPEEGPTVSPPKQLKFSEFLCKERNRWGVGRREKRDTFRSSAPSLVAEIKVVLVPPYGRNATSALRTCQCTRPL